MVMLNGTSVLQNAFKLHKRRAINSNGAKGTIYSAYQGFGQD